MNTQTNITLAEYQKKLGGYVGMLYYNYSNLCIKAEAVSLLSTVVLSADGAEKIEEVAAVIPGDDDFCIEVHPYENKKLSPLTKGILREHPEFKIDVFRSEDRQEAKLPDDLDKRLYLLLTMPEVDKDRRDVLTKAADTLYDTAAANIDKNKVTYSQRILAMAANEEQEEIDMLKEQLDETYDIHKDRAEDMHDKKIKEIEDAYKRYVEKHGEEPSSASSASAPSASNPSSSDTASGQEESATSKQSFMSRFGSSLKMSE